MRYYRQIPVAVKVSLMQHSIMAFITFWVVWVDCHSQHALNLNERWHEWKTRNYVELGVIY